MNFSKIVNLTYTNISRGRYIVNTNFSDFHVIQISKVKVIFNFNRIR